MDSVETEYARMVNARRRKSLPKKFDNFDELKDELDAQENPNGRLNADEDYEMHYHHTA